MNVVMTKVNFFRFRVSVLIRNLAAAQEQVFGLMLWESTSSPFVESINPLKSNAALEKKKKSLRRSVQNLLQLPVFAQEICLAKSSTTAAYQTTVFPFQQLYFTTIIGPGYM